MFKRIVKNSTYLILSQGSIKLVSLIYTIFLARVLGVVDYGLYIVALSYFSISSSIADFGINQYLVKELSADKNKLSLLLPNALILRMVSVGLIFIFTALFLLIFDRNHMRVGLILLSILSSFPQAFGFTLESVFISMQKIIFPSIAAILINLTTVFFGIYLVSLGHGPIGAILAVFLGQIFYALFYIILFRKYRLEFFNSIKFKYFIQVFKQTLPYGFLMVLGLMYFKIDGILLNYMVGSYETGIYGIAYKFLEAVVFVPSAITVSLFPVLSKLSSQNSGDVYRIYKKALLIFFGISIIIAVAYFTILPVIISVFLSDYVKSIPVVRILAFTIPFLFMISVQGSVLLSNNKFLKGLIFLSVFNLLLNITLNLIYIPIYSYFASAYITVFSDLIGFLIFFIYIRKGYSVNK